MSLRAVDAAANQKLYVEEGREVFSLELDRHFAVWSKGKLDMLVANSRGITSLAEIGCGTGHFLQACRDAGIKACGYDLRDHRRVALDVPFVQAPRPFEALGEDQWDAVAAFHVLEHCADPLACLKAAITALRGDGVVAMEVPGVLEDVAPAASCIDPCHLWYFTETTLRALISKAGGEVRFFARSGPTMAEVESQARAGRRITAIWKACKRIIPGWGLDAVRRVLRPRRIEFNRVVSRSSSWLSPPCADSRALNLFVVVARKPA